MQCFLYKIYFWKVFHMNYNWICTPICTKILFLQKVGVTRKVAALTEGTTTSALDRSGRNAGAFKSAWRRASRERGALGVQ
jgi:hypothetical protein